MNLPLYGGIVKYSIHFYYGVILRFVPSGTAEKLDAGIY